LAWEVLRVEASRGNLPHPLKAISRSALGPWLGFYCIILALLIVIFCYPEPPLAFRSVLGISGQSGMAGVSGWRQFSIVCWSLRPIWLAVKPR
jgi:hypothetical protein